MVLLFFPLAFTGTCTEELCSIRDNYHEYESLDSEVVGISVDSPFTLAKYKEEQKYNFPLLSDFNKEVSRSYGSLYDNFILDMREVSKRSVFVIDRKGTIQHVEVLENAMEIPDFTVVKNVLEDINKNTKKSK